LTPFNFKFRKIQCLGVKVLGCALIALSVSTVAHAQSTSSGTDTQQPILFTHLTIGPEFGLYIPASGKASNRFGSQWWSIGLGFGQIGSPSTKGTFSPDLSLIARYSSSNHVYIVPAGVQYRVSLSDSTQFRPYAGVSADFLFADVLSPVDNIHSGIKTRGAGSVFVGAKISPNGYVEARYISASHVDGMDLSGLRLSAGIRF